MSGYAFDGGWQERSGQRMQGAGPSGRPGQWLGVSKDGDVIVVAWTGRAPPPAKEAGACP